MRIAAGVLGALLVIATTRSAILTVVVPRAERVTVAAWVFRGIRAVYAFAAARVDDPIRREAILARYGPVALMALPVVWAAGTAAGFVGIFVALDVEPISEAIITSTSALTTLGFARPEGTAATIVATVEGLFGLGIVALLISFLPTFHGYFSRRELLVARLGNRAGTPATPTELFTRHHRIGEVADVDTMWPHWEDWFAELGESHSSHPVLTHFRSQDHRRSWVTSAGVVLDAAALRSSTLALPRSPDAELCLRSGYLALRQIADFYRIDFDADPAPDDPISVSRQEFDEVVDRLHDEGVPVKSDRDQCWRDFAGWRVNYDDALIGLCRVVRPPPAVWSSDRT